MRGSCIHRFEVTHHHPEVVRSMLEKLSRQTDSSLRLQEISTLLIQEGNLDALYERVLDAAIGLMSADMGDVAAALQAIKAKAAPFISRGDRSGTHIRELDLWKAAAIDVAENQRLWYTAIGQGMPDRKSTRLNSSH